MPLTGIGFEYDPVMYAPLYWGNPLAVLNAVAALDTVHGYYLTPNGNGPTDTLAYGYTDAELAAILATDCPGAFCRVDSYGNDYYMIPAKSLPIFDLITGFLPGTVTPFVKPIVDLISPVAEVLINLGYDWSGDPGVPRTLSILPFNPVQNWFQVGLDLVDAVGEGIENATGDLTTVFAPPAPAATTPPPNPPPLQPSLPPSSTSNGSPGTQVATATTTAADTAKQTSTVTDSGALKPASAQRTATSSQRQTSGNLFRPRSVKPDTLPGAADGGSTSSTTGATTSSGPSSATGGSGSSADSQGAAA